MGVSVSTLKQSECCAVLETEQQWMQDGSEQATMSTSAEHVHLASLRPLGQSSTVAHAKVAIMGISHSPVLGARTNFFLYHGFFQFFWSFIVYTITRVSLNKNDVTAQYAYCWRTVEYVCVCVCVCVQLPASCEHPYHCSSHGDSKMDFKVKNIYSFLLLFHLLLR